MSGSRSYIFSSRRHGDELAAQWNQLVLKANIRF